MANVDPERERIYLTVRHEAIAWGAKIPTGCKGGEGCIEIRPIASIPPR